MCSYAGIWKLKNSLPSSSCYLRHTWSMGKTNISPQHCHYSHNHCFRTNQTPDDHPHRAWIGRIFTNAMKQQSGIANLPKFSMIILLLSLLISKFYFLSQFLPFSLIFCCFLNKTFIMMIITWILRAMFKSPMVMPSMTSNASKILVHYICGLSLVMIGQKLRPVSREMWQFHLNMNIEGTLWRHTVTSSVTSWTSKNFLCNNLWCSLHISRMFSHTSLAPGGMWSLTISM